MSDKTLFTDLDREERYTDRLAAFVANPKERLNATDVKAIRTLLEERDRLRAVLLTVRNMRTVQIARDLAQNNGVSRAQGLDELIHRGNQIQKTVDGQLAEELHACGTHGGTHERH